MQGLDWASSQLPLLLSLRIQGPRGGGGGGLAATWLCVPCPPPAGRWQEQTRRSLPVSASGAALPVGRGASVRLPPPPFSGRHAAWRGRGSRRSPRRPAFASSDCALDWPPPPTRTPSLGPRPRGSLRHQPRPQALLSGEPRLAQARLGTWSFSPQQKRATQPFSSPVSLIVLVIFKHLLV